MWRYCSPSRLLARNSHQPTAAGAHLPHLAKAMWGRPEFTTLGSDKGLDVLSSRLRALSLSRRSAEPSRSLVSSGICAPSIRAPMRNAGLLSVRDILLAHPDAVQCILGGTTRVVGHIQAFISEIPPGLCNIDQREDWLGGFRDDSWLNSASSPHRLLGSPATHCWSGG